MALSLAVGLVGGVVEGSLLVTSATSGAMLGVFLLAALAPVANGRGALCGMLASHAITAWMAAGRLIYVRDEEAMLPLSVEVLPLFIGKGLHCIQKLPVARYFARVNFDF